VSVRQNFLGSILLTLMVWSVSSILAVLMEAWWVLYFPIGTLRALSMMVLDETIILDEPPLHVLGWFVLRTVAWLPVDIWETVSDAYRLYWATNGFRDTET